MHAWLCTLSIYHFVVNFCAYLQVKNQLYFPCFSGDICKDMQTCYFWVIWACLVTQTQNDNVGASLWWGSNNNNDNNVNNDDNNKIRSKILIMRLIEQRPWNSILWNKTLSLLLKTAANCKEFFISRWDPANYGGINVSSSEC